MAMNTRAPKHSATGVSTSGMHANATIDTDTGTAANTAKPAMSDKRRKVLIALACFMLVISALAGTMPFILMMGNHSAVSSMLDTHAQAVAAQDKALNKELLKKASEYNTKLLGKEQNRILGEAIDPFTDTVESFSTKDADYNSQLNKPDDGIMARVIYPAVGIDQPIYHGTDYATLDKGAGHMYGTSLPVGGTGTHAVISAHTGYADKLFFDRLHALGSKAKVGDVFYIDVLGEELGYEVKDIRVVEPDDFSAFGIDPTKDQVTLMTCTPYGVNTQRLLVTGERVALPNQAPFSKDAKANTGQSWMLIFVIVFWVLVVGVIALAIYRLIKAKR